MWTPVFSTTRILPASQLCFLTNSRLHPHLIPTPTLTSPGLVGGTHTPQSASQTFLCIPALDCRLTLTWALKPRAGLCAQPWSLHCTPTFSSALNFTVCSSPLPSPQGTLFCTPRTHSLPMPGACHLAPPHESLSCLGVARPLLLQKYSPLSLFPVSPLVVTPLPLPRPWHTLPSVALDPSMGCKKLVQTSPDQRPKVILLGSRWSSKADILLKVRSI